MVHAAFKHYSYTKDTLESVDQIQSSIKKKSRDLSCGIFSSLWERCLDLQLLVSSPRFVLHWLNITFTLFETTLVKGYFLCSKKNWRTIYEHGTSQEKKSKKLKCKYCRKYCSLLNLPFTSHDKCMPKLAQIKTQLETELLSDVSSNSITVHDLNWQNMLPVTDSAQKPCCSSRFSV